MFKLADFDSLYKQRLEQFGIGSSDSDVIQPEWKRSCWPKSLSSLYWTRCSFGLQKGYWHCFITSFILFSSNYTWKCCKDPKAYDGPRFHILWQTSYAVPSALFEFVCMIEHGVDIKSQLRFGASKTDSAMVQLLQYNCYWRHREYAFRHSTECESLFPVF